MESVDIIMPVYNPSLHIRQAIDSILSQSYKKWKLYIIDDASDKNIVDILNPYLSRKNIFMLENENNMGAVYSRMKAIKMADGDLIAFQDQDDIWREDKLHKQVTKMDSNNSIKAIHSDICYIDADGEIISNKAKDENDFRSKLSYETLSPRELSQLIFQKNSIRLISSLIERSAFESMGGFNPKLYGGEDWHFWVRFTSNFRITHIDEPLIFRRVHQNNTSSIRLHERLNGQLEALELMVNNHSIPEKLVNYKKKEIISSIIKIELKNANIVNSFKNIIKYLKI